MFQLLCAERLRCRSVVPIGPVHWVLPVVVRIYATFEHVSCGAVPAEVRIARRAAARGTTPGVFDPELRTGRRADCVDLE